MHIHDGLNLINEEVDFVRDFISQGVAGPVAHFELQAIGKIEFLIELAEEVVIVVNYGGVEGF